MRPTAVVVAIILAIASAGCGTRTTPPGPTTIGTSAPGMNITYLHWNEGLAVLFVDNVKGARSAKGSGSTRSPVYLETGSGGSPGSAQYRWKLETTDGKSASLTIDGKDFDLSAGTVFVLKAKGNDIEIHQLQRELSTIPFDAEGCKEHLQKDAEISKILATGEADK